MTDFVFIRHGQRRCTRRLLAAGCRLPCRPRNPRATPLFQLLDTRFETLKRLWEERFDDTDSGEPSGIPPSPATSIVNSSTQASPASLALCAAPVVGQG